MAVIVDFPLDRYEDGVLYVNLAPPAPVGGQALLFQVARRFGSSSPLLSRSCASGYVGVSGVTVTSSGQGQLSVRVNQSDFSGQPFGNYAYQLKRVDSGFYTDLTQGYCVLKPSIG